MSGSGLTGQSEMTEPEITLLLRELKSSPANGGILEIGTAAGGTLVRILKALPDEEHRRVVVIDTFDYYPDHLGIFKNNLARNGLAPDVLDVRVTRSNIALLSAVKRDEKFSFIVVDGSHKFKHVMQDLQWLSRLSVGGMAALHDYTDHLPGVVLAVKRFLARNKNYKIKAQADTLLILEKTAEAVKSEVTPLDLLYAHAYTIVLQNKKSIRKISGMFRR